VRKSREKPSGLPRPSEKTQPDSKGSRKKDPPDGLCGRFFRLGSPVYDDMTAKGVFIHKTKVTGFRSAGMALHDAFNPEAREYYWNPMDNALFRKP
jgi:alpha-glucosidase (family GH31 glycosyl hydrolase)